MECHALGVGCASVGQRLCGPLGMVGVFRNPGQVGLHRITERGERDRRLALKQRSAQLALQCDDPVGQRRLGDAAAFGGAGKIAFLAQRQEIADLVHLHVFTSAHESRSRRDPVTGRSCGWPNLW